MNHNLEFENSALLDHSAYDSHFEHPEHSKRSWCRCGCDSLCSVDLWYNAAYFISLTVALACSCLVAEAALLMVSFLSLCLSMRCSCIYIVGAVFAVFMNNWSGIQDWLAGIKF